MPDDLTTAAQLRQALARIDRLEHEGRRHVADLVAAARREQQLMGVIARLKGHIPDPEEGGRHRAGADDLDAEIDGLLAGIRAEWVTPDGAPAPADVADREHYAREPEGGEALTPEEEARGYQVGAEPGRHADPHDPDDTDDEPDDEATVRRMPTLAQVYADARATAAGWEWLRAIPAGVRKPRRWAA